MQVSNSHENESLELGLASDQMRILVIEDDRDAAIWLIKGLTESVFMAMTFHMVNIMCIRKNFFLQ